MIFSSFFLVVLAEQWLAKRIATYKEIARAGEQHKDVSPSSHVHEHEKAPVQEVDPKIVPLLPPISPVSYDSTSINHHHAPNDDGHHHDHSGNSLHTHDVSFVHHDTNSVLPYLLTAGLAFHSIFEGIVLGLQTNLNGKLKLDLKEILLLPLCITRRLKYSTNRPHFTYRWNLSAQVWRRICHGSQLCEE